MSRRHKEYPTISAQEIRQVAEETSQRAIKRAVRNNPYQDLVSVFPGIQMVVESRSGRSTISTKLSQILCGYEQRLTDELEASLNEKLSRHLCIIDEPEASIHTGRGHPKVLELFDRFKDCDVIDMLKEIYREHYHSALEQAKNLVEHAMCFLLAFCDMENTTHDGLLSRYHGLLKDHLPNAKIPTVRTIQGKFARFRKLAKKWKDRARSIVTNAEEALYKKWVRLKGMYMTELNILAPQYARY